MTHLTQSRFSPEPKRGALRASFPARAGPRMCVNQKEFDELVGALDRSLAIFGERPPEPGFDQTVFEELRRVRETLIRARWDLKEDPNLRQKKDSKSPMGSP